mgnify:CR=1 FL=1
MSEKQVAPVIIKINEEDYKVDELSDNAKAQLQGIQAAEAEMKRLNVLLALARTARNAYVQALQSDLPEVSEEKSH